jgi:hypothetical protein
VPLFAGCLIAAGAGVAAAQPPEPQPTREPAPPPQQAPSAPPPASPPPAYEARDDAAWRLYHEAFGALLQGKRRRAGALAARLRREHAGHPAAALVDASPLALAGARGWGGQESREEPTSGATAELALFQTLHGLTLGVELCIAVECDDPEPVIGLSLAGGVAGAVLSLKALGPVTSGQRALLNSGTVWGAFNAIMAIIAGDPDDASSVALGMIGGQGLGLTIGAMLYSSRPTAGQVALASTGGQWGGVLMGLVLTAASTDPSEAEIVLSAQIAADAGLAMGAYLATIRPEVSRAQTFVIDAGGIVGGVAGGGLGVLISGSIDDPLTAGMAAIGVAAGLGAASYFTRNWGDSGDGDGGGGAHAVVVPAEHGRGGLVGLAGAW